MDQQEIRNRIFQLTDITGKYRPIFWRMLSPDKYGVTYNEVDLVFEHQHVSVHSGPLEIIRFQADLPLQAAIMANVNKHDAAARMEKETVLSGLFADPILPKARGSEVDG